MSLIHLEKSVLTFHLKEILDDGHESHPLTWLGLGILIFGPKLLPTVAISQPTTPTRLKTRRSGHTQMSLSQWIAEAKQRELATRLYATIETKTSLSPGTNPQKPDSIAYPFRFS
jgi:hypothetical protein